MKSIENDLKKEYTANVIINCTGLGSSEITNEPMYSLRGAVINLVDDGKNHPRLKEAHCVSHDNITTDKEIVFIVPRGENKIILGAIAEKNEYSTDINFENYKPIRDIYNRCIEFLPYLKNLKINSVEPVRAGLRPFREENVRLDVETGTSIIHSYGHGGAGFTFSWGCAEEVAEKACELLSARENIVQKDTISA